MGALARLVDPHRPPCIERAALGPAHRAYIPSSLSIIPAHTFGHLPISARPVDSFRAVVQLHLHLPSRSIDSDCSVLTFLDGIAASIGPQLQEIHCVPGRGVWLFRDLVDLSTSFPHLHRLQICSLLDITSIASAYRSGSDDDKSGYDTSSDGSSDNDGVVDPNDNALHVNAGDTTEDLHSDEYSVVTPVVGVGSVSLSIHGVDWFPSDSPTAPVSLSFPRLTWLGLGQLVWFRESAREEDHRGFEPLLAILAPVLSPMLTRLDILQYVGPLSFFLSRWDSVLRVVCFSSSVMHFYTSSLVECSSIRTLHIVVDCFVAFPLFTHPYLSLVSIYIPAILGMTSDLESSYEVRFALHRLLSPFLSSTLPMMRTISLCTEVPLPSSRIDYYCAAFYKRSVALEYVQL